LSVGATGEHLTSKAGNQKWNEATEGSLQVLVGSLHTEEDAVIHISSSEVILVEGGWLESR